MHKRLAALTKWRDLVIARIEGQTKSNKFNCNFDFVSFLDFLATTHQHPTILQWKKVSTHKQAESSVYCRY